jgi:histidyl-tRNA synthetase
MGDAVLGILLEEKGKMPQFPAALDCFVVDGTEQGTHALSAILHCTGCLRTRGYSAEYSYRLGSLGRQLKEATRRGARYAVILLPADVRLEEPAAQILKRIKVGIKNLATGEQTDVPAEDFLEDPGRYIGRP